MAVQARDHRGRLARNAAIDAGARRETVAQGNRCIRQQRTEQNRPATRESVAAVRVGGIAPCGGAACEPSRGVERRRRRQPRTAVHTPTNPYRTLIHDDPDSELDGDDLRKRKRDSSGADPASSTDAPLQRASLCVQISPRARLAFANLSESWIRRRWIFSVLWTAAVASAVGSSDDARLALHGSSSSSRRRHPWTLQEIDRRDSLFGCSRGSCEAKTRGGRVGDRT